MKAMGPLFLAILLDLLGFGMVVPFLPRVARELGASDVTAAWVISSYSLMQLIFVPLWGRLSDRVGRKPVLIWSIAATSVFMALLGLATSVWVLLAARVLAGIATSNIAVAQAYIADVTEGKDRTKGMGMLGAAFGIGFVLGPLFGGMLSDLHWLGRAATGPSFVASGLSLVNLVWAVFVLKESLPAELRGTSRLRRASVLAPRAFVASLRGAAIQRPFLVNLLLVSSFAGLEYSFTLFAKDAFGMSIRQVGGVFFVVGIVGAVIQGGLIRQLSKLLRERTLIVSGALILSLGFGLLVGTPAWGVGSFYAVAIVTSIGHSFATPALSAYVSRAAPAESQGTVLGLFQSAGSLGRVVGPLVAGGFYGHVSHVAPYVSSSVGMLLAGLLAATMQAEPHPPAALPADAPARG